MKQSRRSAPFRAGGRRGSIGDRPTSASCSLVLSDVVHACVMRLRNPRVELAGLRYHLALESDPVRNDLLCAGVELRGQADNHWANDRLRRASISAIHPLLQPLQRPSPSLRERVDSSLGGWFRGSIARCRRPRRTSQVVAQPVRPDVLPGDFPVHGCAEATWVGHLSRVRDLSRWILAVAPPCGCRAR
jgi:hypothetical protein